ncbi:hypothetical protein ACWGJ2_01770 [Streptomyces sp. NPDC054796]
MEGTAVTGRAGSTVRRATVSGGPAGRALTRSGGVARTTSGAVPLDGTGVPLAEDAAETGEAEDAGEGADLGVGVDLAVEADGRTVTGPASASRGASDSPSGPGCASGAATRSSSGAPLARVVGVAARATPRTSPAGAFGSTA